MKKILAALLVLALVAPAMAVVDFAVVNNANGTATITINTNGAVVRGVGLSVACTGGAKLVDLSCISPNVEFGFNTCIDYAFSNQTGYDIGEGHPYALASDHGVAAINDTNFSISLGVLDNRTTGAVQAGFSNTVAAPLATIKTGAGSVCIDLDSLRGGVVGDGTITTNLDGLATQCATITAVTTCRDRLTTTEKALYDRYVVAGKDPSLTWCTRYHCHGDASNSEENLLFTGMLRIYNADLGLITSNWKKKPETGANPAADVTHSEESLLFTGNIAVYNADLGKVISNWKKKSVDLANCPLYVP